MRSAVGSGKLAEKMTTERRAVASRVTAACARSESAQTWAARKPTIRPNTTASGVSMTGDTALNARPRSPVARGARQREISVSEFFTKNRHLLGFDNPRKSLLTCVKEAVDNALDACEEAEILPDIVVKVEVAGNGETPPPSQATRFRITITD